jgi:hypothetical protein
MGYVVNQWQMWLWLNGKLIDLLVDVVTQREM